MRRFSIDVIEKTPKFTTKFYRLDTVPSKERTEFCIWWCAAGSGSGHLLVKIRVSPSGLLHRVVPSAACCGGASWDQALCSPLSLVWCAGCLQKRNYTG